MNTNLKSILSKLDLNPNRLRVSYFKKNYPELYLEIDNLSGRTFPEKVYLILNDLEDIKKCNCGKELSFISFISGYSRYCSSKCANLSPEVREKTEKTNLEKYGCKAPAQAKTVMDKMKSTTLERYGVENAYSSLEIKEKIKKTNMEKFGVENWKQRNISEKSMKKLSDPNWIIKKNKEFTFKEIGKELGVSGSKVHLCFKNMGLENQRNYWVSSGHREILNYITKFGFKCITTRQVIFPYELDIYIPEKNLAIEYNGLYWHSYGRKETVEERNRHLNKTLMCTKKGIRLLHIFENEWVDSKKRVIWESLIKNRLGLSKKIGARECYFRKVDDYGRFLDENHLQGNLNGGIGYGLYFGEELVSLMVMGKCRFGGYEWEMYRFCNKLGLVVVGGASRLFSKFIDEVDPSSVVSYSDLRLGGGSFYSKLGFRLDHRSSPNYYYVRGSFIYSRMKFQKHKLGSLLRNFDISLSEGENMFNNDYRRLWDCGNEVYEWKRG